MIKFKQILVLGIVLLCLHTAKASHIRAGEIIATRTSVIDFSFHFTLVLYTSDDGPTISPTATITANDGWTSADIGYSSAVPLGNNITRMEYEFDHTFASDGDWYISYQEFNRVGGVLNMSSSGSSPFFVETRLKIDNFQGLNNSPQLLVPPIDNGATGQVYNYNSGAYDADGDSLVYELVVPLQDNGTQVFNYINPGDAQFSDGGNSFVLDVNNGNLIWNFPDVAGLYNIAFRVWEYRNGQAIGFVHRDMQINIIETENIKPELVFPENKCYLAEDTILEVITATDFDNDDVELIAFGGVINNTNNLANFTQTNVNVATGEFFWVPACEDVREEAYQVIFKADDGLSNDPSLVDIEVWEIEVYGPPPTNLVATTDTDTSISLNWDNYTCANAEFIEIWRKDCSDPTEIECNDYLGDLGYVIVDSIDASSTSYIDNDNNKGLKKGKSYCYRLVAKFPAPQNGTSIPSDESCENNGNDYPYMLNVSVEKTDPIDGEIFVRWTDRVIGGTAPKFRLYRAEGETPEASDYQLMSILPNDTAFYDTNLNTKDLQYSYKAKIVEAKESNHASSVRLEGFPRSERVDLEWHADVPWSITSGLKHYIFRKYESKGDLDFVLIDSVDVFKEDQMIYTDTGQYNNTALNDEDTVCYYVITQGTYCNDLINGDEILINKSQEICVVPQDTTPPCPPFLSVETECIELENLLSWIPKLDPEPCFDDIDYYEVYRLEGGSEEYKLVGTTPDTSYLHSNLDFVTGCYKVRGVDLRGNIGPFSDSICVSDCPRFILPNVFTPNEDNENVVFTPLPPVRGVKNVVLTVYNRWGKKIYHFEGDPEINWDGGNLADGLYFYKAEIEIYTLIEEDKFQKFKGWVQIIR